MTEKTKGAKSSSLLGINRKFEDLGVKDMLTRLKRWVPSSIRHKLIWASVACIAVPALVSLILYNAMTKEALKEQAVQNANDALQLIRGSVTNLLSSKLNIANYIQVNSTLNSYFKQVASGNEEADPYDRFVESRRVLEHIESLTVVGEPSYVTVLLTSGAYYMNYSVSDYNPLDYMDQPWFDRIHRLQGLESLWVGPEETVFRSDRMDHPYQLSVVRTLRLPDSDIYGYVIVSFTEDQISRIFDSLSEGSDVLMLDGSGMVVSSHHPERIGTKFPYVEEWSGSAPYAIMPMDGEKHLMVEQDIPFAGWRLVLMQPYKDAIVNINAIFSRAFLLQMGSFLVFLMLLIGLVRTFTKPLVRLGKATAAVQRGNLEVRSHVRGNDEIGRLGHLFDDMLSRIQTMIFEISDNQSRKRKAELKMLQAQIHPHFLFNVLNSIRMKVMKRGDPESARMIGSLSMLLRMTISRQEDEIALHEELELISHYLALMNLRQKEEVRLELDIASEALLLKVPRFFLQPIVENALIHGLNRRARVISITAVVEPGGIILRVKDDGAGMDPSVRERIARSLRLGAGDAIADAEDAARGRPSPVVPEGFQGQGQTGTGDRTVTASSSGAAGGDMAGSGSDRGSDAGSDSDSQALRTSSPMDAPGSGFSGIGLSNVMERMRMVFGSGFQCAVYSEEGQGTVIEMYIPERGNADV
ncbi:MAG TPA: two-component sensor histidine kinase [Paenibacillus lactis]|nr:two-component sensor histidine kinase [Paenibacillus lactis]